MIQQATKLKYLDFPQLYSDEANVIDIWNGPDGPELVLDETIFYPQGGGQQTDRGVITGDAFAFEVTKVSFNSGVVYHRGKIISGTPSEGPVQLEIDSQVRMLNSALHSGGHVVMKAARDLRGLTAIKGYHFPDGPYVEFAETVPPEDRARFAEEIQAEVDRIVSEDKAVTAEYEDIDALRSRGVHIPSEVPADKPTRVVTTGGYESPCGGTHVVSLHEIGKIEIRGVKAKGGQTRVAYQVRP